MVWGSIYSLPGGIAVVSLCIFWSHCSKLKILVSLPQAFWWPFQVACVRHVYLLSIPTLWVFIAFILWLLCWFDSLWAGFTLLINPKSWGVCHGRSWGHCAPGPAFLARGRWCFHSSYSIFQALPVESFCWDVAGNWGTGMGLIRCSHQPPLLCWALLTVCSPQRHRLVSENGPFLLVCCEN